MSSSRSAGVRGGCLDDPDVWRGRHSFTESIAIVNDHADRHTDVVSGAFSRAVTDEHTTEQHTTEQHTNA
jgi:hypothetical protein